MSLKTDATDRIPLVDFQAEYAKHGQATASAMAKVAESGHFIMGPSVGELEQKLSETLTGPNPTDRPVQTIAVSDGTAALQLSLMALNIGSGHEVITTPFTWISTAEVIPLVGATPVFADIDPSTFLIDPHRVQALITPQTRAIIAVSLFGLMPDLAHLRKIIDEAEEQHSTHIALIEDAAQSFGARRANEQSCASEHTTLATTSFFPTKPLACYGDGGAIFTTDSDLADSLRALRLHGKQKGKHIRIGINSRLDTIQAAVLLAKLPALAEARTARQRAAERYTRLLQDDGRVVLPTYLGVLQPDGRASCAWGVYTVRVERRDEVVARLQEAGIGCAVYYKTCCHEQPAFEKWRPKETGLLAVSERMSRSVLSLPMHPYLAEDVQLRVVRELRTILDDLGISEKPE